MPPPPLPTTSGQVTNPALTFNHNYKLKLRFEPAFAASSQQSKSNPPWFVVVEVRCHNLPKLMREGLRWTEANIDRRASFFDQDSAWKRKKHPHFRQWILSEHPGKSPKVVRWYGTIRPSAMARETLSSFRLEDLSRDDVASAEAFNKKKQKVFEYDRLQPEKAINTIYDELHPAAGSWWIWPMERASDTVPPYTDDGTVSESKKATPA